MFFSSRLTSSLCLMVPANPSNSSKTIYPQLIFTRHFIRHLENFVQKCTKVVNQSIIIFIIFLTENKVQYFFSVIRKKYLIDERIGISIDRNLKSMVTSVVTLEITELWRHLA